MKHPLQQKAVVQSVNIVNTSAADGSSSLQPPAFYEACRCVLWKVACFYLCAYCGYVQVGLMVISMVTCSLMHASILKTGKRYVSEEDEADFIFRCRQYAKGYRYLLPQGALEL